MIYKIDHYYNIDHDKQCLIIESKLETEKLIKILASIQFMFEELINDYISIDEKHILEILKEFYGAVDVKEKYKDYLIHTKLENKEWEIVNIFQFASGLCITQIDLYEARESCCGSKKYNEAMKEGLPEGKKKLELLKLTIKNLKNFYS